MKNQIQIVYDKDGHIYEIESEIFTDSKVSYYYDLIEGFSIKLVYHNLRTIEIIEYKYPINSMFHSPNEYEVIGYLYDIKYQYSTIKSTKFYNQAHNQIFRIDDQSKQISLKDYKQMSCWFCGAKFKPPAKSKYPMYCNGKFAFDMYDCPYCDEDLGK